MQIYGILTILFFSILGHGQIDPTLQKARRTYEEKNFQESIDLYYTVLSKLAQSEKNKKYYEVLFESSKPLVHLYKYTDAEQLYDIVVKKATDNEWATLLGHALNAKIVMHDFRGEQDSILIKATLTLELSKIDQRIYSDAHTFIGRVLSGRGEKDSAHYHFKQAIEIDYATSDSTSIPWSEWDLGRFHSSLGNIKAAISHYLSALDATPIRDKYKTASFYGNISAMFLKTRNFEMAEEYAHEGLQVANQYNLWYSQSKSLGSTWNN